MMPPVSQALPVPRLVIFDWDDTLVDNYAAIHAAINAARAAFGLPVWSLAETRQNCRIALKEIFPVWFGAEWEKAQAIFYETFALQHLQFLRVKPGAEHCLLQLQQAGIPLAVNSNKKSVYLREEIGFLGWDAYFKVIVGAGDVPAGKPAPDGVEAICRYCGVIPSAVVWFVGDNAVDVATANNAGITPMLVGKEAPETMREQCFPALPNLAKYFQDIRENS